MKKQVKTKNNKENTVKEALAEKQVEAENTQPIDVQDNEVCRDKSQDDELSNNDELNDFFNVEQFEGEDTEEENKPEKEPKCKETENNEIIEKLKIDWKNINDKHLRLMAEYDNYRKRTLKEKADLMKTAGEKILTGILPLIDDFERALQHIDNAIDVNAVKEGTTLIYNKFINFLLQQGIKEIEATGKDFDAEIYEAITKIPAPNEEMKGKILDCVEKGYMLDDKVIRYPKVVVGE